MLAKHIAITKQDLIKSGGGQKVDNLIPDGSRPLLYGNLFAIKVPTTQPPSKGSKFSDFVLFQVENRADEEESITFSSTSCERNKNKYILLFLQVTTKLLASMYFLSILSALESPKMENGGHVVTKSFDRYHLLLQAPIYKIWPL